MKKSTVETRIKEIQDRIDNITHNSWRPYLVSAEYINFDTYKPYRRRYYTDYVGTTPLLFRNIQQILKLEVWQGDAYRELAGAYVTYSPTVERASPGMFFGLPNGSSVRLEAEGGVANTQNWVMITNAGTGYGSASRTGVSTTTTGSGSGMTVDYVCLGGAIHALTPKISSAAITRTSAINAGYASGDTITVTGFGANATFRLSIP